MAKNADFVIAKVKTGEIHRGMLYDGQLHCENGNRYTVVEVIEVIDAESLQGSTLDFYNYWRREVWPLGSFWINR